MSTHGLDLSKLHILDGGFATELERSGCPIRGDPLWGSRHLFENPDMVKRAHVRFLQAGATIIETNTYQAYLHDLVTYLNIPPASARDLLHTAVRLAREAIAQVTSSDEGASPARYVAGAIGPYGIVYHTNAEYEGKYVNDVPARSIVEYYKMQAQSLLDAGVDILAFETVPSLKEGKLIVVALQELRSRNPAWISFSCRDAISTNYGEPFKEAVQYLSSPHSPEITAVGVNCTSPWHVTQLLQEGASVEQHKPFIAYPNSGENWSHDSGWLGDSSFDAFVHCAHEWVKLGAKIVGGCCRVTPEQIAKLNDALILRRTHQAENVMHV